MALLLKKNLNLNYYLQNLEQTHRSESDPQSNAYFSHINSQLRATFVKEKF